MPIQDYLDPTSSPSERPSLGAMHAESRELHQAIDAHIRGTGVPYLHPEGETLQLDLLGSPNMIAWQEGKAAFLFSGDGCWSGLPQVYARYGTETTRRLIAEVRRLEGAAAAVVTDCGMQACALLFDVLLTPGSHAVIGRQSYNKTKTYLGFLGRRIGAEWTVVDDGDYEEIAAAIHEKTTLVFLETFTNPLTRAVDPSRLSDVIEARRGEGCRRVRVVVDDTIASPWSPRQPLLEHRGVDFIVASGTKSLGGEDRDLWGYIASNRVDTLNEVMDLQAMRGGILDWRRAAAVLSALPANRSRFERRCATASRVAAFLASHPKIARTWHPSLPDHPDREVVDRHYRLPGSLLSFRLRGLDEGGTRHFCDVLATCVLPRYALSFDGLVTKLNHHQTVSEYFTPPEELERTGIDRLVRLGVGLEHPDDIIACLNWALWNHDRIAEDELAAWRLRRASDLGIYEAGAGQ